MYNIHIMKNEMQLLIKELSDLELSKRWQFFRLSERARLRRKLSKRGKLPPSVKKELTNVLSELVSLQKMYQLALKIRLEQIQSERV